MSKPFKAPYAKLSTPSSASSHVTQLFVGFGLEKALTQARKSMLGKFNAFVFC